MVRVSDIYDKLNMLADVSLAESYDNVGILCGDGDFEVKRVLIALDASFDVIDEARDGGFELIVTHHPVCFEPVKKLDSSDALYRLAKAGVSLISMHTNLDRAAGGVDDMLAKILDISNVKPLGDFGRVGRLRSDIKSLNDLLSHVEKRLRTDGLKYYDAGNTPQIVATVAGSGGDFLKDAILARCDTFITGEVKYHHYVEAKNFGINLIEAGHFATENPICDVLRGFISAHFPGVLVKIASSNRETAEFYKGDKK